MNTGDKILVLRDTEPKDHSIVQVAVGELGRIKDPAARLEIIHGLQIELESMSRDAQRECLESGRLLMTVSVGESSLSELGIRIGQPDVN